MFTANCNNLYGHNIPIRSVPVLTCVHLMTFLDNCVIPDLISVLNELQLPEPFVPKHFLNKKAMDEPNNLLDCSDDLLKCDVLNLANYLQNHANKLLNCVGD